MPALTARLDRAVEAGVLILLAFTPLAFGAMEDWSRAVAQGLVLLIAGAWLLTRLLDPARGWRRSGLEWPGLLFAVVVALQLLPLPPALVETISPSTARIFAEALPDYGRPESSFRELPRWLQSDPRSEAGGVPALPPDPDAAAAALDADAFEVRHPRWRALSLDPFATRGALLRYLAHLALFVVVFNHYTRARVQRLFYALTALVGLLAVEGLLQDFATPGRLLGLRAMPGEGYPFGPFVNHNNFAGWMELALPPVVGIGVMWWDAGRRRGASRAPAREVLPRLLGIAAVSVVGLVAFLFARSRGGLLALAGAAAIAVLVRLGRGRVGWRRFAAPLTVALVALTLAALLGGAALWERYRTLGQVESEPSLRMRWTSTVQTLGLAYDFPWSGTGLGTFAQAFDLYTSGTSYKRLVRAHDDYVQVLAECGLPGFAALLWAGTLLLLRGIGPALSRAGSRLGWPMRGVALGLLALLLHGFVDFNLQITSNSLLFVVLGAVLLRAQAERREPQGSPG